MKKILSLVIVISIFLTAVSINALAAGMSAEDMYREGKEFFEKEDYDRAFARFQIAGEVRGYAPAQNMLGICYRDGLGIERDLETAEHYFQLAADQGYVPAQENLADMKKALEEEQNKKSVAARLTSQVPEIISLSLDEQNNPVVTWLPVEGAEQYQIIRRIGKDHRRFVLTVNPDTTSYPIKSCQEGQDYAISVRARFEFNMEKGTYNYSEESEAWTIRIPERITDESAEVSDYVSSSEQKTTAEDLSGALKYTTVENGLINGIPANGSGYVYMGGIKWRVLGKGSSSWLLISADVLGGIKTWVTAKGYGNSQMSTWFSGVEQDAVLLTSKTESYDSGYYQSASGSIYSADNLYDESLFLLSAEEAETYFSGDDDRQPGWWWLRSTRRNLGDYAGCVYGDGYLSQHRRLSVDFGTRPAFQLNLSSVLFTSAASGGKSITGEGGDDFGMLTEGDELKLTLIDGSSFSASVNGSDSASIPSDGRIEITYSEVTDGRQVSALLYVGGTIYYATHRPDGTGKWIVTLPSGLSSSGTYTLKVFSEQLNEDYKTDYASTPVVITLNGGN